MTTLDKSRDADEHDCCCRSATLVRTRIERLDKIPMSTTRMTHIGVASHFLHLALESRSNAMIRHVILEDTSASACPQYKKGGLLAGAPSFTFYYWDILHHFIKDIIIYLFIISLLFYLQDCFAPYTAIKHTIATAIRVFHLTDDLIRTFSTGHRPSPG